MLSLYGQVKYGEALYGNSEQGTDLYITSENLINPLGMYVLKSDTKQLMPSIREQVVVVPGMDGEYDFGSDALDSGVFTLKIVSDEGLSSSELYNLEKHIAKHLNPKDGWKTLSYEDDPNRLYYVKLIAESDLTKHSSWFSETLEFQTKHYTESVSQYSQQVFGTTASVTISSHIDTPFVAYVSGYCVDPGINLNGHLLQYTGTIETGELLAIDTENLTCKIGGINVMLNLSGMDDFVPRLSPDGNVVITTCSATLVWKDRWLV